MHQSTTLSLSQTIWPRWASRQFVSLPIVQTLLPVTFGYSLSSEAVVMRELRRWKRLWRRSLTRSHKRTSIGSSRSALQSEEMTSKGTNVLSIKVPIRKNSGNLSYAPRIYIYIIFPINFRKWNGSLRFKTECDHRKRILKTFSFFSFHSTVHTHWWKF